MADKGKIIETIGAIKACFPYFGGGVNPEVLVNTWCALLKDFSNDEIERAVFLTLQSSSRPPAPADIIEKIREEILAAEESPEELWSIYHKALVNGNRLYHDFPLTFVESNGKTQGQNAREAFTYLWESLPDKIRAYLATEGEFKMRVSNLDREDVSFEHNRFLKALPGVEKMKDIRNRLSSGGVDAKKIAPDVETKYIT